MWKYRRKLSWLCWLWMTTRIKHLYIHVPFCKAICYSCDFARRIYDEKLADKWLERLEKEISDSCHEQYETIYIGGGTPSCLSPEQSEKLLSLIYPYASEVKEYTIEANPESLDKVGAAVKMNGGNAQAITSMIAYLAPQSMSPDAQNLCDELLNQSRTLAGASDAQLGNIDLSRVSGTAAQTIRDQQQLPLNEQQEMYQDFIENVALLWFELWKVYFPMGVEMDGISVEPEEIENILPSVRVDIAEDQP